MRRWEELAVAVGWEGKLVGDSEWSSGRRCRDDSVGVCGSDRRERDKRVEKISNFPVEENLDGINLQ